jgi:hypothetical protein
MIKENILAILIRERVALPLKTCVVQDDPKLPDDSGEVSTPNGVVGNSIPSCKTVLMLDGKTSQVVKTPHVGDKCNLFCAHTLS